MFKKILCGILSAAVVFYIIVPVAFADNDLVEHEHKWTSVQLGVSGEFKGFAYEVSAKQCSVCKLYDHVIKFGGIEYNYLSMTADPGAEGMLQSILLKLYGYIFGANASTTQVPADESKDLPGYADDNGTPTIGADGFPTLTFKMSFNGFSTSFGGSYLYGTPYTAYSNGSYSTSSTYDISAFLSTENASSYPAGCISYYFVAPYDGYYEISDAPFSFNVVAKDSSGIAFSAKDDASVFYYLYEFGKYQPQQSFDRTYSYLRGGESYNLVMGKQYFNKGVKVFVNFYYKSLYGLGTIRSYPVYIYSSINFPAPTITVTDIGSIATINKQTNITINNDISQTWNGNIYTDNSTNLTYIYPQYTTINEKNETVTNISTTPIIYNNETKQYYTYDQTTKNYYYINYEAAPTPTPAPTETPTPSPKPTEEPSPSPTSTPGGSGTGGGGDVSTPETGKPGNSSGSSWWDKLLSKIGDAIIDGLLGAVSAVLKLIFKLFSTILSWIIWAVSRVFDLLPFLPPGLGGLLVGGVVVCFVIGIIKFIRG